MSPLNILENPAKRIKRNCKIYLNKQNITIHHLVKKKNNSNNIMYFKDANGWSPFISS